jgi:hypothetical protein
MTSLSTWLRAAIGSSRCDGLTQAPTRARGPRTRKAGLPGHAIPRPGPPLSLPWSSFPASPDEFRAVSRRGSRGQSVPRLPSCRRRPRPLGRANPDTARGPRPPLHQRPLGPGAGALYPPYLYRPVMQAGVPLEPWTLRVDESGSLCVISPRLWLRAQCRRYGRPGTTPWPSAGPPRSG